jgi:hypothetical protein
MDDWLGQRREGWPRKKDWRLNVSMEGVGG